MGFVKIMGVSSKDDEFVTTFFRVLQRNQLDQVQETLQLLKLSKKFSNVHAVNTLKLTKSGDTPLHICARNGFIEILRFLIEEEDANIELINLDGKTALHDAAQFTQPEVVEYLLSKGANVNVVKKADWTPLMLACTKENLHIIQTLVVAGANLSFVNKDGWTCIHIAAREGHNEIVSFLLNSCVDPAERLMLRERKSRNGRRPIHTAVLHGHLDVVKLLTMEGTLEQINAEDNCGSSPLLDACRCGFAKILEYFIIDLNIDPKMVNKNGVGLLHVAAEANQAEMIELLVKKYKLDVNEPSTLLSFTPLHWASREGNLTAVKTLISLGADWMAKDLKQNTAVDIANEYSKIEILEFFNTCTPNIE